MSCNLVRDQVLYPVFLSETLSIQHQENLGVEPC